jgi:hypothetical protein
MIAKIMCKPGWHDDLGTVAFGCDVIDKDHAASKKHSYASSWLKVCSGGRVQWIRPSSFQRFLIFTTSVLVFVPTEENEPGGRSRPLGLDELGLIARLLNAPILKQLEAVQLGEIQLWNVDSKTILKPGRNNVPVAPLFALVDLVSAFIAAKDRDPVAGQIVDPGDNGLGIELVKLAVEAFQVLVRLNGLEPGTGGQVHVFPEPGHASRGASGDPDLDKFRLGLGVPPTG